MKQALALTRFCVTGAFFWFVAAFFSTVYNWEEASVSGAVRLWVKRIHDFMASLDPNGRLASVTGSDAPAEPLNGLWETATHLLESGMVLSTLAILFVSGLLLDLIGSFLLSRFEGRRLVTRILPAHRAWLEPLVQRHRPLAGASFDRLTDTSGTKAGGCAGRTLRNDYRQFQNFVLAITAQFSKEANAQLLMDRLGTWQTCRAVAATLLLYATVGNLWEAVRGHGLNWWMFAPFGMALLALSISCLAYDRAQGALFAQLYVVTQGENAFHWQAGERTEHNAQQTAPRTPEQPLSNRAPIAAPLAGPEHDPG